MILNNTNIWPVIQYFLFGLLVYSDCCLDGLVIRIDGRKMCNFIFIDKNGLTWATRYIQYLEKNSLSVTYWFTSIYGMHHRDLYGNMAQQRQRAYGPLWQIEPVDEHSLPTAEGRGIKRAKHSHKWRIQEHFNSNSDPIMQLWRIMARHPRHHGLENTPTPLLCLRLESGLKSACGIIRDT